VDGVSTHFLQAAHVTFLNCSRFGHERGHMKALVLWLFVINLGIAFGAGVYEQRIVVPRWIEAGATPKWNAEAAVRDDTGRRFWAFVTTLPLTLLTLASVYFAWRARGTTRLWWLAAAALALTDRLFTFAYFIPAMVNLMRLPDSADSVAMAMQWSRLNTIRHVLVLSAWLAALRTFAVLHQRTE
jgi:hypothetical protein